MSSSSSRTRADGTARLGRAWNRRSYLGQERDRLGDHVIRARTEGIRRGDDRDSPLLLKVRRTDRIGQFEEEIALELEWRGELDDEALATALTDAVSRLARGDPPPHS